MISLIIPTWNASKMTGAILDSPTSTVERIVVDTGEKRLGVLDSMILGAKQAKGDYLAFIHDDVDIYDEEWAAKVEQHFSSHSGCGLVGFGGALGLGDDCIYKRPYQLTQLKRHHFLSNMKDWRIHGYKADKPTKVSVLDGFSQVFRRTAYIDMGGWEGALQRGLPQHHMYDAYSSCMMARFGWSVWLLPIACHHYGGKTATTIEYAERVKQWGFRDGDHLFEVAHRVIYDEFPDILPLRV